MKHRKISENRESANRGEKWRSTMKESILEYYTRLPVNYITTGKAPYHWLNSGDRILEAQIDKHERILNA